MRSWTISLIALIVALSSLWLGTGEVSFNRNGEDMLSAETLTLSMKISNPAKKDVILSDRPSPNTFALDTITFRTQINLLAYYLPLYDSQRPKNYFLLI